MGYSKLEIERDPFLGEVLVAGGESRKGGAYIARITGLDQKYGYAREFLGQKEYPRDNKGVVLVKVQTKDLHEGDLLEIRCGGSWKNDYRDFYIWENNDVRIISEKELRQRLAERQRKAQEGIDKIEALQKRREELLKELALIEEELALLTQIKESVQDGADLG
ncbi:MAG: hypothetical protein ACPL5F_04995 [Moorellaceae bacterium]